MENRSVSTKQHHVSSMQPHLDLLRNVISPVPTPKAPKGMVEVN